MSVPTRTVYIGNISFSSTSETLMEAFADYQPISVKIIEGKGIAFLEVPARRAFGAVRDLDGSKLDGRMLSVSIATPRDNEPTFTQDQNNDRVRRNREDSDNRFSGRPVDRNPRFSSRDDNPPAPRDDYRPSPQGQDRFRDNSDRPRGDRPDRGFRGNPGRPNFDGNRPPRAPGFNRNGEAPSRPDYRAREGFNDNRPPRDDNRNRPGGDDRPRRFGDRPPFDRNRPQSDFNRGSRPPRPDQGGNNPYRGPGGSSDRPMSDDRGREGRDRFSNPSPNGPAPQRGGYGYPPKNSSSGSGPRSNGPKPRKPFKKR